ncbi:MAG: DnaA/Hda family protein, partial [Isosphaeraceae bacterium]
MDASPAATPSPMAQPWDGFVTGPESALAMAGVLALARGDALGVSPLVLHGASGVGKTRLLQGLVGEWLIRRPASAVAHLEAEAFAAACAEATTHRDGWAELRARFRALDLFVLDDLHDLERAPLALTELVHTLDALAETGAGVVVTARTGPGQWLGWPPRLVNRLIGGLSVRIEPPGLAARRRFLLDRAREKGLRLPAAAVDAMAEAADGFRTLDGWLARLALTVRVDRRGIDLDHVTSVLEGDPATDGTTSTITLGRIVRDVARRFGVSPRDLRAATRRKAVAEP